MDSKQHHGAHLAHNKRNKKRNVKPIFGKSTSKPCNSAHDIINDFKQNTTLLGVQHILRNKSIFWILAYICCLIMSVVQTWSTAAQYFEKKSHQRYGIESKRQMPFPSVTICNNIVLPLSFIHNDTIPGYNQTFDEIHDGSNISDDDEEELRTRNNEAVLKYVRSLTHDESKHYAVPTEEWLVNCSYAYQKCDRRDTKLFYEFNHPFDGTCLTFNPAFHYPGVEVDIDTKLMFTMRRKGIGYQITSGKPHVSILVHAPGTTPLMDLPEAIDIFAGQSVNLGLRLTQKDFMMKNVYPVPTCVISDDTGQKYREKNLYYHKEWTPYEYSIEACMKTCIQERVNKPCKVLDATFPILDSKYESGLKIVVPPIAACNETDDLEIGLDICECLFPCKIYQYYLSTDTTEFASDVQKVENNTEDHVEKMRVTVQYLTNIFDHIEEELDYNITQFMGILGGNLSLWLGLCILSLLEIVELLWRLICYGIKSRQVTRISEYKNNSVLSKYPNSFTCENCPSCRCRKIGLMNFKRNPKNGANSGLIIRNRHHVMQ